MTVKTGILSGGCASDNPFVDITPRDMQACLVNVAYTDLDLRLRLRLDMTVDRKLL
jgi:hypothetical protein